MTPLGWSGWDQDNVILSTVRLTWCMIDTADGAVERMIKKETIKWEINIAGCIKCGSSSESFHENYVHNKDYIREVYITTQNLSQAKAPQYKKWFSLRTLKFIHCIILNRSKVKVKNYSLKLIICFNKLIFLFGKDAFQWD